METTVVSQRRIHSPLCAGEGNCTCDNPLALTFADVPGEWVGVIMDDGTHGFIAMESYLDAFKRKH